MNARGSAEIEDLAHAKAKELFDVCDKERKGFISREDLQKLQNELEIDVDLCQVFARLDVDQSGFLSFEEFRSGFGEFLNLTSSGEIEPTTYGSPVQLDGVEVYEHDGALADDSLPGLLGHDEAAVEDFVRKVVDELNETKKEKEAAERSLKERAEAFEKRVQKLSEEMEEQMERDRQQIFEEEVMRERNISLELKSELRRREEQLHDVIGKQGKLEEEVSQLSVGKTKFIDENNQLLQLNESLALELDTTRKKLDDSLVRIGFLKQQQLDADAASRAEEEARRLDLEKRSLMTQVQVLRDHNRKLQDERDELQRNSAIEPNSTETWESSPGPAIAATSTPNRKFPLFTQGSNVGKYFAQVPLQSESGLEVVDSASEELSGSEESIPKATIESKHSPSSSSPDHTSQSVTGEQRHQASRSSRNRRFYRKLSQVPDGRSSSESDTAEIHSKNQDSADVQSETPFLQAPDRVYKVVFVGNSGVGKSSFIERFVSKTFRETISATIGVDYQVKTLVVAGRQVALQLWDTAGQERYRSITRQYFRKADGVVVVYDVTSEKSFLGVRGWMQSVQEGISEASVVLLLGNKSDVEDNQRQVRPHDGTQLANEYGAKFFETSAKSGRQVTLAMMSLSKDLILLENKQRESVLSLAAAATESSEKNNCCGVKKSRGFSIVSSSG